MHTFRLAVQPEDSPRDILTLGKAGFKGSFSSGRPAQKQHRAGVPACLEDTHRLRLWLAAERLHGGST